MERVHHHQIDVGTGQFSRDPAGLPMAEPMKDVVLNDGDELDLHIAPVANRIGDQTVRMLARLQRFDPRPHPPREAGLRDRLRVEPWELIAELVVTCSTGERVVIG